MESRKKARNILCYLFLSRHSLSSMKIQSSQVLKFKLSELADSMANGDTVFSSTIFDHIDMGYCVWTKLEKRIWTPTLNFKFLLANVGPTYFLKFNLIQYKLCTIGLGSIGSIELHIRRFPQFVSVTSPNKMVLLQGPYDYLLTAECLAPWFFGLVPFLRF